VIGRVQSAIYRARGIWAVQVADPFELPDLLGDGWEPFTVEADHIWLRRRERDSHAATLLLIAAVGLALLVRWVVLLLLALVVVA
jgi:hypothetical protein